MNQSWKKKISYIALIVLGLVLIPVTYTMATYNLDPKNVTVTFSENDTAYFSDLNQTDVDVYFYQIAQMDANGDFDINDAFTSFATESDETHTIDYLISNADQTQIVTSDLMLQYSNDLVEFIENAKESGNEISYTANGNISAKSASEIPKGTVDVVPGLYLIVVPNVKTPYHEYQFTPSMAFIPNSTEVELKAKQSELTADLTITKTLQTYDNLTGQPMFVFDVNATDENGNVVFSDVVGLSFDEAGAKSATITGIPAGSTVTIEEIYSTAAYTITSSSALITLEKITPNEDNVAEFTNDYTHSLVFGTGVVNHFSVKEDEQATGETIYSWEWSQQE
ncbi:MAG: hypothetical protein E7282_10575 [Lachnospiraceae bacterium]|nr:hypothetical protein [Lachnospiraceae bacterium]